MFKKFLEKNIFNTRDSVLVETFDTCEILYTFVGSEFWNFEKFEFKKKYGDYDYGSKELHTGEKRFPQGMSPKFCRKKSFIELGGILCNLEIEITLRHLRFRQNKLIYLLTQSFWFWDSSKRSSLASESAALEPCWLFVASIRKLFTQVRAQAYVLKGLSES